MEPIAQSFAVDQLLSNVSWLRALAVRLVRDEATAEDLTHETLVAALEHQPATNRSLRPWLARVLRNSLSKRTRGSAARAAREDSVARDEILPSSEDLLMRGEMQSRLVAEVLKLDDPYRSLVLLRFYEGLEPSEIARKRDQSAGSVRGQLSRAVGILRERLDASDAESQLDWRGALLPLAGRLQTDAASTATAQATPFGTIPSLRILLAMNTASKLLLAATVLAVGFVISRVLVDPQPALADAEAGAETPGLAVPPSPEGAQEHLADSGQGPATPAVGDRGRTSMAPESPVEPVISKNEQPIIGRLVSTGTGDPLAHFLMTIARAGAPLEDVVTGADGRFESAESYAFGELQFRLLDAEDLDRTYYYGGTVMHAGKHQTLMRDWRTDAEIMLELEPTLEFPLRLVGPRAAVNSIETIAVLSHPFATAPPGGPAQFNAQVRRTGDHAWVRFAPFKRLGAEGDEWHLQAESPDGLWVAQATIPAGATRRNAPISLVLEPAARIEVVVPWGADEEPGGIAAALGPTALGGSAMMTDRRVENRSTIFTRGALLPGSWTLLTYGQGTEIDKRELELGAGEVRRVEVALEFPAELHACEVRITSETGNYHSMLSLSAHERGGARRRYGAGMVEWQEVDGEWVGTQALGSLAPGEYGLELALSVDGFPWATADRTIQVPGGPYEIRCLDGASGAAAPFGLRVVHAETLAALGGFVATISPTGDDGFYVGTPNDQGVVRWATFAGDSKPKFKVSKVGFETIEGDWSQAELEDGARTVEVRLVPVN